MSSKPIKVAFLTSSLRRGGTELRLLDIVRGLDRSKFDPFLLVAKDTDLVAEASDQQVYVVGSREANVLRSLPGFWSVIRRQRPQVVWCVRDGLVGFAGRVFAGILRIPVVVISLHRGGAEQPVMDWPNRLLTLLTRTRVVVVSDPLRDWLIAKGISSDLITTIYNGVDTALFAPAENRGGFKQRLLGIDPDQFLFGTVGNLRPVKGQDLLIRAAAKVITQHPDTHLVLVGEGNERKKLEELCAQLKVEHNVHFLGARSDVPELLHAFDVFTLTSYKEGCPNSVLEAMASGVPVISTEFGGAARLISAEVGIIIPERDEIALADALISLIRDPVRRQEMGKAARRRALEFFSLERMIKDRETLLLELLKKKGIS